jgi:hypothetical protein
MLFSTVRARYNYYTLKAGFHCGRFVRAGRAGFENLLTRA